MSGKLVGEVIDAAEAGTLPKLSRPAFSALIAIAEKCHEATRQGSVRQSRIQAAIYAQNSPRTAVRAVKELKAAGLVTVVKRGFKAPDGSGGATIFGLAVLSQARATQAACASEEAHATQVAYAEGEAHAKSAEAHAKSGRAHATLDGAFDGSIDGSIDGEAAHAPPPPGPPENIDGIGTLAAGMASLATALSQGQPVDDDPGNTKCPKHRHIAGWVEEDCPDCGKRRARLKADEAKEARAKQLAGKARARAIKACNLCDEFGWPYGDDGTIRDDGKQCDHKRGAA